MRKALGILLSIMLILGFISCQQATNSSDDDFPITTKRRILQ